MKRWNSELRKYVEDHKIDAFLSDLVEVYRKHGMSLGHEDSHGAFCVELFDQGNVEWLMEALDETTPPPSFAEQAARLRAQRLRAAQVWHETRVPEMQEDGTTLMRDRDTGKLYLLTGEEVLGC